MAANALNRHLALAGFMGAGKTTLGEEVARRLRRPFVDLDHQIEREAGTTIEELFARDGEPGFRVIEERVAASVLEGPEPAVIALGGGAVLSGRHARAARTARLHGAARDRSRRPPGRGRARAGGRSRSTRRRSTRSTARGCRSTRRSPTRMRTRTTRTASCWPRRGSTSGSGRIDLLEELVPGNGPVEIVADANVAGIHGVTAQLALGDRDIALHEVPPGEPAKAIAVLERLWRALRIGRDGTIVGLGGGCTTDLAGFAAATYMRGVPWVAVPTTLVGQVDAAIGGKTAVDLPGGKNLVGAFHWPARVVIDPGTLETLPELELGNGMAEVVKTGLLMGRPVWELPLAELVRRCASFKAAVCIADPHDRGPRNQLNLGHTFGHALEAAAGYDLPHGRAVALGMVAALRLSGNDAALATVREQLDPQPVASIASRLGSARAGQEDGRRGAATRAARAERRADVGQRASRPPTIRAALDDLIVD